MDKKQISELIKRFVRINYGKQESDNPSWDIKLLADYIVKNYK